LIPIADIPEMANEHTMQTVAARRYDRIAAITLASASLLVSLLAGWVKIYFWGGTHYASVPIKLGFWFVILAGPISLWFAFHKPRAAMSLAILQALTIIVAAA
jgi:hypothetical protein